MLITQDAGRSRCILCVYISFYTEQWKWRLVFQCQPKGVSDDIASHLYEYFSALLFFHEEVFAFTLWRASSSGVSIGTSLRIRCRHTVVSTAQLVSEKDGRKCANISYSPRTTIIHRPGSIFLVNGQRSNDQMIFAVIRETYGMRVPRVTHQQQRNSNTQERDADDHPEKDFFFSNVASAAGLWPQLFHHHLSPLSINYYNPP